MVGGEDSRFSTVTDSLSFEAWFLLSLGRDLLGLNLIVGMWCSRFASGILSTFLNLVSERSETLFGI